VSGSVSAPTTSATPAPEVDAVRGAPAAGLAQPARAFFWERAGQRSMGLMSG
jgi:hypothetical protein